MARTKTKRKPDRAQLQMLADDAAVRADQVQSPAPPPPAPTPETVPSVYADDIAEGRPPFGSWLIKQHQHTREWIATLAKAAKADPRFSKGASVEQAREYLAHRGADGDMFEALDDAEMDWLSL